VRVIIAVVAAVLAGTAAATAVSFSVTSSSSPDKSVNFTDVHQPQPWAGVPNYGDK
jgi:hypothetical protein